MTLQRPQTLPVTVVITVLNDASGVTTLLRALLAQTQMPDEIIIVDGGSTDGTVDAIRQFDSDTTTIRCIPLPQANIAAGRNHGIACARNTLIACTDAGCVPAPEWLENILAPLLADNEIEVVGGMYKLDAHSRLERVVGLITLPGQLTPVDPTRFNPSARSIAFRKSAAEAVGGFPDWLYTAEDTLFDCKLRRAGCNFAYASNAIVHWRPRPSLAATWRQFRNYARGEAHIGRGGSDLAFWRRRYALAATLAVACVITFAITGGAVPLITGATAVAILLAGPFSIRARQVAWKTGSILDFALTPALGHWIVLAQRRGWTLGGRDCQRAPDIYIKRLREEWGSNTVDAIPPWPMKSATTPRTLIVSWHWPPTSRASTGVLASLFATAPPEHFHVLTRDIPAPPENDCTARPAIPTTTVPWFAPADTEDGNRAWLASIAACVAMIRRARRLHRERPFERILAVYPHRYSLLAGLLAARITGVPLVAYMHDLFAETLITRRRTKRAFWSYVERVALRRARLVIVPTREFVEHYARRGISRTWVLPHCAPPAIKRSAPPRANDSLHLVYSGSIYQAHEDAVAAFIAAAQSQPDLRLTFLTNPSPVLPPGAAQWLPRSQAIDALHAADAFVVALGADTPYPQEVAGCFPSKFVDYLAIGRPILAVVPRGSFVDRLINETGCGLSAPCIDPAAIAAAIDQLRDADLRQQMTTAAHAVIEQLAGQRWMSELCRRLALGAPQHPCTPTFPARRRPAPRRETEHQLIAIGGAA